MGIRVEEQGSLVGLTTCLTSGRELMPPGGRQVRSCPALSSPLVLFLQGKIEQREDVVEQEDVGA